MKKLLYILAAAAVVFSCAKEQIQHPSEKNVPEAASFQPVITVDQETNEVTFSLEATAVIPVWVFQNSEGAWADTHTGNGYKRIFASAGDYSVRMQVMNASGVSPDYVEKSFHIDNTIVNFDKYITILSKGPWHIDGSVEAHMACGETVENPTGWWSAPKNDKAAFGVYDNKLSFSTDGKYTFDPGEPGTVYVNIGVTVSPFADAKGDATADFQAPAQQQTTEYGFDVEGESLYLALEPGALFPYIPNNDFVTDTRFLITEFAAKSITLVWFTPTGNGGSSIAWQFILTNVEGGSEPVDNPGGGDVAFDYNSSRNLWKAADAAHTYSQYYAPGWKPLANPEITNNGNVYSFTCPSATSEQWQNQFFIIPDAPIALSAEKTYDFQCKVTLSQDVNQVTFKLTDTSDDGNFLFTERHNITAYEEFTFTLTGVTGIDAAAVKMVFDFGGNPDNTEVEIKEIILQEHEGEVSGGGSGEVSGLDYNSADNLWKAADAEHTYSQYYATTDSWTVLPNPEITQSGNSYSFTLPTETKNQWQAQFFIIPTTPIPLSAAKTYDFQCKVELSQDVYQVTFKLTDTASDGNFLFTERRDISAYDEFTFTMMDVAGIDADAVKMVFDFGGNPANTEVTVKEIILREHK